MYLEDHHCFEEAFRVYERGVSLFHFPHSRGIWREYLSRFISRYGGNKLERARELFERVRFPREFHLVYSTSGLRQRAGVLSVICAAGGEIWRAASLHGRVRPRHNRGSRGGETGGISLLRGKSVGILRCFQNAGNLDACDGDGSRGTGEGGGGAVCGPGDEAGGVGPCPRDLRVCGAVLQPADGGEFLGRLAGIRGATWE